MQKTSSIQKRNERDFCYCPTEIKHLRSLSQGCLPDSNLKQIPVTLTLKDSFKPASRHAVCSFFQAHLLLLTVQLELPTTSTSPALQNPDQSARG